MDKYFATIFYGITIFFYNESFTLHHQQKHIKNASCLYAEGHQK